MYESDTITELRAQDWLPTEVRARLWFQWDRYIGQQRLKLKWGIFHPSFRIGAIFEPIVAKWIGPRPGATPP